ncbi:MAG: nucleotide exchange factor GrpE [Victivallaceae bacterium]|nr:nucleotide exchange factor GrpE [Victivallaceae bacterium]
MKDPKNPPPEPEKVPVPDAEKEPEKTPEKETVPPESPKTEKETAPKEPTTEEKLAALANQYLYLQAEYQNYRKRVAKDLADARQNAIADTLTPFLTVFDYLSMADNAAVKSDNVESIRQGLKMIIDQFFRAFGEIGVAPVESVGQAFDPQLHDAVAKEASESIPEGTVIREWSRAFKLGDKVLRPARVVVSSGAPKPETDPAEENAPSPGENGENPAPENAEAK